MEEQRKIVARFVTRFESWISAVSGMSTARSHPKPWRASTKRFRSVLDWLRFEESGSLGSAFGIRASFNVALFQNIGLFGGFLVRLRHFGLDLGNGWARLPMDQRKAYAKDFVSRQNTERHRANQRANQRRQIQKIRHRVASTHFSLGQKRTSSACRVTQNPPGNVRDRNRCLPLSQKCAAQDHALSLISIDS